MRVILIFSVLMLFFSCNTSKKEHNGIVNSKKTMLCDYIDDYKNVGNTIIDTIKVEERIVDPIDNILGFKAAKYDFFTKDGKVYKKAKTHRTCNGQFITVEYLQDVSYAIELSSYKEINDRFFSTMNTVKFWWVNSDGHMVIPIDGEPDPETFQPFENICGGKDKNAIYYGCPNYGVYKLNIPVNVNFEFISKPDNYWNSPKHYVIIEDEVYDIKYNINKGYYSELNKELSPENIK